MEKKPYYVSVQANSIMQNQGDAAYEFEIHATPEEIEKLSSIFEDMAGYDRRAMLKANAYTFPYHLDPENDGYDSSLREAYEYIYELGSSETKRHIEKSGLLHLGPNNG